MFQPFSTAIAAVLSFLVTMEAGAARAQLPAVSSEATFTADGRKPVSGARIAQMLVGNTTYSIYLAASQGQPRGTVTSIFWRDRRRATIVLPPTGTKVDASWWIEADRLCIKYVMGKEVADCARLYEVEGTHYSCLQSSSRCIFMLRMVPGNAEKL